MQNSGQWAAVAGPQALAMAGRTEESAIAWLSSGFPIAICRDRGPGFRLSCDSRMSRDVALALFLEWRSMTSGFRTVRDRHRAFW